MAEGPDEGVEPTEVMLRAPGPTVSWAGEPGPASTPSSPLPRREPIGRSPSCTASSSLPSVRYLYARAPGQEEDLASEVWLDAPRGLPAFSGDEDDFGRWIFTIARRRAIDAGRKRQRRKTDVSPPSTFAAVAGDADPEGSVVERLAGDEAVARSPPSCPKTRPRWCCCGWWPA